MPVRLDKLEPKVQARYDALSRADRRKVEAIVQRHISACLRNGTEIEGTNRIYIESIEMVEKGETMDEPKEPYVPFMKYQQYVSPKVLA
jgi:hypothetical protein